MSSTVTEAEYSAQEPVVKEIHPLCRMLRELRRQAGLSLGQVETRYGISAVVVGAYERGDREPPMRKMEACLAMYGYKLTAVPVSEEAIQLAGDMVASLRAIAAQLEARALEAGRGDLP
jgi:transcriptional regulator with XRE-family HTH domain